MPVVHPDANAFVAGILAEPTDRLRRLVFADWLDEQNDEANAAWAGYIRTQAEWETTAEAERRSELIGLMKQHRPAIRARLTLPARAVQPAFLHLLRLLPSGNVTIRLNEAEIPLAIIELLPESVARENIVLPIGLNSSHLALVTPAPPRDRELADRLGFILNKTVVMFHAAPDEVLDQINRRYGQSETESIDSISWESPLVGLEYHNWQLSGLFVGCFEGLFNGFRLHRERDSAATEYFDQSGRTRIEPLQPEAYEYLLIHLQSLEVESEATTNGIIERRVNLPLLSGRPCPIRFERPVGDEDWYRLTFLWG